MFVLDLYIQWIFNMNLVLSQRAIHRKSAINASNKLKTIHEVIQFSNSNRTTLSVSTDRNFKYRRIRSHLVFRLAIWNWFGFFLFFWILIICLQDIRMHIIFYFLILCICFTSNGRLYRTTTTKYVWKTKPKKKFKKIQYAIINH